MGNSALRGRRAVLLPPAIPYTQGHSDNVAHSHALTTTNAPWNITQWIDPFDPHPKVTTMPLVLVVRKN